MTGENLCYAVVFLAEGLIAWSYMTLLFEKRQKQSILLSSFVFGYFVLYLISRQIDTIAVNGISFMLVNSALLFLNYSCNLRTSLLHGLYMSVIMALTEFLPAVVLGRVFGDYTAYTYRFTAMITLAVLSKLLYFWMIVLSVKIFCPSQKITERSNSLILFCILPLASFTVIVSYVYICMAVDLTVITEIIMIVSALFLLSSNILLFILYFHMQKIDAKNFKMQLLLQKEQADTTYYAMLQEQYDRQRILVHDIKNHLQVIQGLLHENALQELEKYLIEVTNSPVLNKMTRFCDNSILNMLLIQYNNLCQQKGINFQVDVREHSIDFLNSTEITALFGNLLENAVDAAQESEEKRIDFSIQYRSGQNIVMIVLVNSCDIAPVHDLKGNFFTHKPDRQSHGVGLKSVQRVIEKHHGRSKMYYCSEQKQFHVVVIFEK